MTDQAAIQYAKVIADLNVRWTPHPTQQLVLRALFFHCYNLVFDECGRKWGKTEIMAYFLWRLALLLPGGYYYFAPEQKQAKEIVWASNRIQQFGPQQYVTGINNTEMRISIEGPFGKSFIKCDGSDNFDSHRGTEPHGLVYDEFRDFRPEFHSVMDPNRLPHKAPLLVCSTPPEEMKLDGYDNMKLGLELGKDLFNYPSWLNPYNDRDWLIKKKAELYAKGEGDKWEREYGAKRVPGGSNAIFPMFRRSGHGSQVRPHAEIMAEIMRDKRKLIWQVVCDPGTMSVFAVLFRAINPFTRVVYCLDEIYETNQKETSTSKIVPRIQAMKEELCPDWEAHKIEWDQVYDEAESWFCQEAENSFNETFIPTQKAHAPIDEGLSLIKDQLLHNKVVISDRCQSLCDEFEDFLKDPKTSKPKKTCKDHIVDVFRYGNFAAGIDLMPEAEPPEPNVGEKDPPRGKTRDQDEDDESEVDEFTGLDDF